MINLAELTASRSKDRPHVPRIEIRQAVRSDVPALVAIFASDGVGGHGDTVDPSALPDYQAAFDRIAASTDTRLFVAEMGGVVAGTFQIVFLTALTGRGATNLLVKAVHTGRDLRGQGIGSAMMTYCIDLARREGVRRIQLSSNAARLDAHRFYERLGFEPTHKGYTLTMK
ncbi:MAG: GNAT family N-acetyltransferase [Pararhizobium sp.]